MTETKTDPENLQQDMGELSTDSPKEKSMAEKKTPRKKKSAAADKPAKRTKAARTNGATDENVITLAELCKDYKIEPSAARRKLRAAELEPDGRWKWAKGSSALKAAEKVLAAKSDD